MKSKVLIGGLIGGITYFLLGFLIYGLLLKDTMQESFSQVGMRKEEEMLMWSIGVSNLLWGFFMALVFDWSNTSSMSSGLQRGSVIGLMTSLAFDMGMYAFSTMFDKSPASNILVDVAGSTVMSGIVGGVIGWYMGRDKKDS